MRALLALLALVLVGQQEGGVAAEDLGEPGAAPPARVERPAPAAPRTDTGNDAGELEPMEPAAASGETQPSAPASPEEPPQREGNASDDGPVAAFWFVDTENGT